MDMKLRIDQAVKDAMRAGDQVTRQTLRLVLAAIKQSEVDQKIILDDTAVYPGLSFRTQYNIRTGSAKHQAWPSIFQY